MPYPEPRPCPKSASLLDGQPRNKVQTCKWWRDLLSSTGKGMCREYSNCRSRTRTDARIAAAALDAAAPQSLAQSPPVSAKSGERPDGDSSSSTPLPDRQYDTR